MPPLLSVIVPNYNNAKYLPACFDSILGQTFTDFEIVVADDSSTDNSVAIIQDYASRYPGRFVMLFHKKNYGIARNRHLAIEAARGQYITTLDSDDHYATPEKLKKEMALVMDYKLKQNQDIIAFSNILQQFGDGKTHLVGNAQNIAEGNILEPVMARSCMIPRDFIFLKSAYFQVGGYDHKFAIYEDWDLKIRLAARFKFFFTGITGIVYLRHGEGLSNASEDFHIQTTKRIFDKNRSLLPVNSQSEVINKFSAFTNQLKNRFYKTNIPLLQEYYSKRQYFLLFKLWKKFAALDPSLYYPTNFLKLIKHGTQK